MLLVLRQGCFCPSRSVTKRVVLTRTPDNRASVLSLVNQSTSENRILDFKDLKTQQQCRDDVQAFLKQGALWCPLSKLTL